MKKLTYLILFISVMINPPMQIWNLRSMSISQKYFFRKNDSITVSKKLFWEALINVL